MKLKIALTAAALLLTQNSFARAVITQSDTYTREVKSLEGLNFRCKPGMAPNGHNFPTASMVTVYIYDIPGSNIRELFTYGPRDLSSLPGDHCAELETRMRANIPGTATVERTFQEDCTPLNGVNAKSVTELVHVTLGEIELHGSETMIIGRCN